MKSLKEIEKAAARNYADKFYRGYPRDWPVAGSGFLAGVEWQKGRAAPEPAKVDKAKAILEEYCRPYSMVDNGNLFFAATEFMNAFNDEREARLRAEADLSLARALAEQRKARADALAAELQLLKGEK